MSISLENLFKILPSGVVSKKDIGDFIMLFNILACSLVAAFSVPIIMQAVDTMMKAVIV